METIAKLKHEMSVLSRQVTAVSQELQEMTSNLHNPSVALLMPRARPASVSSHCRPCPASPTIGTCGLFR
ncbi:potassium voltage-gated channel subfamily H member 8-like isoform X1 [Lates japonicus]|uniref:Potassium voltage-gated channel subfamily H member 8-like isoform X1 n=1 Tax=Lates japonicus TaxID=270547 RepID=A0AAD3NN13_LATJO|nr:potassium voltage-gated channel subfamily H member 8-like isoform X1 [Lates japonicus]